MAATTQPLTEVEIDLVINVLAELHGSGRFEEEALMRRLMKQADPRLAELLDDTPWTEDDLTEEDRTALDAGLAALAAGKTVPHEVVKQGPTAVRDYQRRRDSGEIPLVIPPVDA